ncbi:MAG: chemotaxis protein CheD [Candidatus Woesearchaeota archaeon]
MSEEIMVDMGKYAVSASPDILVSLGLGSCVGVAIYDSEKKIGGLAHIMLPNIYDNAKNDTINQNKFADVALPNMLKDLESKGCNKARLKAKIAGGAHMFSSLSLNDNMDIGKKNAEAVKIVLEEQSIPITVNETGGNLGRTIRFDLSNGILKIKTKDGIKEL